ncbi:MAG: STAS domain-containing protein [Thiolinea sp.]
MKLSVLNKTDFTIIKVKTTRIDAINSPNLRRQIKELTDQGINRIIIDLSSVTFMDSSGLGTVVSILKMLGVTGDLVIAGANGVVADLFTLTRMDRVFRMCSDAESAEHILETA